MSPDSRPTASLAATPQPLSSAERMGYGLGDAACNVVFQFILAFMPFFYTDVGAMIAYGALPMVERFGRGDDQLGFQRTMTILAAIAVAMLAACFALTKERAVDADAAGHRRRRGAVHARAGRGPRHVNRFGQPVSPGQRAV